MSALMDAYQDYLSKTNNPQIPQIAALPQSTSIPPDYTKAYYEAMGTPATVPQPTGLQDVPGAVSNGYKAAGGGVGGVALGALAGLGKLGEFAASKTGNQILAGTAKSPYLAEGYLNNANQARQNELAQRQMAFQLNQENLKGMGEDVRAQAQQANELRKTYLENQLQMPLKVAALQNEQAKTGIEATKATQDTANQQTERQQEALKTASANRSLLGKIFGTTPKPMTATNSMGHTIASYDEGKTWQ